MTLTAGLAGLSAELGRCVEEGEESGSCLNRVVDVFCG